MSNSQVQLIDVTTLQPSHKAPCPAAVAMALHRAKARIEGTASWIPYDPEEEEGGYWEYPPFPPDEERRLCNCGALSPWRKKQAVLIEPGSLIL